MWKLEDFELGPLLGQSEAAKVYKAVEKKSGKRVALKIIALQKIKDDGSEHITRREVEIQSRLR